MKKLFFLAILCIIYFSSSIAQVPVSIKIDLGNTNLSPLPWNNLTSPRTGKIENLKDSRGLLTEIDILVTDAFNGINNTGTDTPDASLDIPASATGDSFFGNSVEFSGATEPTAAVELLNLDTNKIYDLSLFASRVASDNRQTQYIVSSQEMDTAYLQVADNIDTKIHFSSLTPDVNGSIKISCTTGPENTNSNGFYYLGAIELFYMDTLIEIDPSLSLIYPNGGEYWQSSKKPEIRWQSQGIDQVSLSYSTDGGNNWIDIAEVEAILQRYEWSLPELEMEELLLRVQSSEAEDQSDNFFQITSVDTSTCHIIVLGSSTAAGTGPSVRDSAWVWRYEDYIFQNDTRFDVTNLAKGGFTSYNLLPTGTEIPTGVSQTVDVDRNVTMARSLKPDAIIINLPSNDAANGYTVADQLNNYSLIVDSLAVDSIVYWIATPQPRNSFSTAQKQIQLDLRDSTFTIFKDFAIDFWNGFEDAANNLDPIYDSGDGVHMNEQGHHLLFQRVLDKMIPKYLLESKGVLLSSNNVIPLEVAFELAPNPFLDTILLKAKLTGQLQIQVFDRQGQKIKEKRIFDFSGSEYLELSSLYKGMYYLVVITEDGKRLVKPIYKY